MDRLDNLICLRINHIFYTLWRSFVPWLSHEYFLKGRIILQAIGSLSGFNLSNHATCILAGYSTSFTGTFINHIDLALIGISRIDPVQSGSHGYSMHKWDSKAPYVLVSSGIKYYDRGFELRVCRKQFLQDSQLGSTRTRMSDEKQSSLGIERLKIKAI